MKKVLAQEEKKDGKTWVVVEGKARNDDLITASDDGRVVVVRVKHSGYLSFGKVLDDGRTSS